MPDSELEPTLVARWAAAASLNQERPLPDDFNIVELLPDWPSRATFLAELNQRTVPVVNQLSNFTITSPFTSNELHGISTGSELIAIIRRHLLPKPLQETWKQSSRLPLPVSEDDSGWTAF